MFVDELTISAKAGDGGDGVVRWRHEKFKPRAGPSGGNGGNGGDVYVRAVRDLNRLSKYTGSKTFTAVSGEPGTNNSRFGKNGEDLTIDIPVGSKVTDLKRERVYELTEVGQCERILKGGGGGLGNEHFKSSENRSPTESTLGRDGEAGDFLVEVALMVDVGLIGLPNAGKSTILNQLTNATSRVGSYPFTTIEPHLGDLHGIIIADIPGLIAGAAEGKGLGHKFLRHISRTNMLLHVVSLAEETPENNYYAIREELEKFDESLTKKEEWIILTKKDLINDDDLIKVKESLDKIGNRVFVLDINVPAGYQELQTELVKHLQSTYNIE